MPLTAYYDLVLSLALLMFRISANDIKLTAPFDELALIANLFD